MVIPVRGVVKEATTAAVQGDEQHVLQLPTLDKFEVMPVPPFAPNAGTILPAEPGQVGAANNGTKARAVANQGFLANTTTMAVGQPIVDAMRPMLLQCIGLIASTILRPLMASIGPCLTQQT